MRNNFFILFLSSLLFAQVSLAQTPTLPSKLKIGKPAVLKGMVDGTYRKSDLDREMCSANKWGTKKMDSKYWVVWSDRDNNTVYLDNTGSAEAKRKLAFRDAVIIASIENDRALVYTDDSNKGNWPEISEKAKAIGWVPMENLLLWDKCPTDDYGIQRKALIAFNINVSKITGVNMEKFRTPTDKSNGEPLAMDMKFYFIMKEEGNQALLCNNPTVLAAGGNLDGWVESANFAKWEQRACLEPNWDVDYVEHNRGKAVGIYVSERMNAGDKVLRWTYGNQNNVGGFSDKYRMVPDQLRFPILKKKDDADKFVYCTAFAQEGTGEASTFDGGVNKKIDEIRMRKNQMNLIFCIEAMPGMGDYFEAVKEILVKSKAYANQGLKVKAGLVLYRNDTSGGKSLEKASLADCDDPNLLSMLNPNNAKGSWNGNKRTVALRKAIETAANPNAMGFNKDNSNLIVIVGNHGEEEGSSIADEAMLKNLQNNNIQVMSLQVVTTASGSSALYQDQIDEMIRENIKRQCSAIGHNFNHSRLKDNYGLHFKSTKNKATALFSRNVFPPEEGMTLDKQLFTKYLNGGVDAFATTIPSWLRHFEQSLSGVEIDVPFLKNYLGQSLYDRWEKNHKISAFAGYAPIKDVDDGDYWHNIVYMSLDELAQLLQELKGTYFAAKEGVDDRKKYSDAIKALAKNLLGQNNDKEIERMSITDLQSLIYGLNAKTEATGKNLQQITDPNRVPKPEYMKILNSFKKKYENLQEIYRSDYKFRAKFGDDYYYWIPIEDLP